MRIAGVIVGVLLAGVVGVSLFHQARRAATAGEEIAKSLRRAGMGEALGAAPTIVDYLPERDEGRFPLVVGDGRFLIDREAREIVLTGRLEGGIVVSDPARAASGAEGVTIRAGDDVEVVSRRVERVSVGGRIDGVKVTGADYEVMWSAGGSVAGLLAGLPAEDEALAGAIEKRAGGSEAAARVVGEQRAAIGRLTDRALFDAVMGADEAVLERDDDVGSAVRRAMFLLARPATDLVVQWRDRAVFAVTEGGGVVKVYGFGGDGKLAWHAVLRVRGAVSPARVCAVIDGL